MNIEPEHVWSIGPVTVMVISYFNGDLWNVLVLTAKESSRVIPGTMHLMTFTNTTVWKRVV